MDEGEVGAGGVGVGNLEGVLGLSEVVVGRTGSSQVDEEGQAEEEGSQSL